MKAQRLLSVIAILTIALFLSGTATAAGPFIDNGDGTVTDKSTDLMWQKTDVKVNSYNDSCLYCEDLELGGYNDWRVPDVHEAMTLIDHPDGIDHIFDIKTSNSWLNNEKWDKSYLLNNIIGYVDHVQKNVHYASVRCVRGSYETDTSAYLVANGDTVEDTRSGLVWMSAADGTLRTRSQAIAYCENLEFAGRNDWGLPAATDLVSILDYSLYNEWHSMADTAFNIDKNHTAFWSSSAKAGLAGYGWGVDFRNGEIVGLPNANPLYVLCVYGGQGSQGDDQVPNDANTDSEHIDGVADGDYIRFGGRDWIMLDNLTGYAILKDYAGTEKIAFDAGGGQTWDYKGKTASSKLYLNTIFFNSLGDDKAFIDNNGEWLIEAGVNDPEYAWNGKVGMLTKTEFEYYNENGPNLTGTSVRAISFPIEDPNFFGQWWLLTPGVGYSSGDSIVRFIADYNKISATDSRATHQGFIRPTLHLKSDLYVKNGDGTSENPKIITDDPNQNEPPMADAGPTKTVELASSDGTEVTLDGSESTDIDSSPETNDDIVDFDWYKDDILLGSGESLVYTFPLGTHTVKLIVTDSAGESDEDEVVITIEDTTPPEVAISASTGILWPPNGKMKDVLIQGDATDISGEVNLVLLVEDEYGEINLSLSDFDKTIQLEAWRKGRDKDGRTYTINVIATDSSGNGAFASTLVVVPHDMGGGKSKK